MNDHDFIAALHKAHVDGNGEVVANIWREIADGEMSHAETLAWAKEVADWITSTDEPSQSRAPEGGPMPQGSLENARVSRVARIHAALAVTGWAEPSLDSLADENWLLQLAMKNWHGQRVAATTVYNLIAAGKASQGTRETWLDFISKGIVAVPKSTEANLRPNELLKPLGLAGFEFGQLKFLVLAMLEYMLAVPGTNYSTNKKGHTAALRQKLQAIGVLPDQLDPEEFAYWEKIIRDEKRAINFVFDVTSSRED
jgi:hypothetical protein